MTGCRDKNPVFSLCLFFCWCPNVSPSPKPVIPTFRIFLESDHVSSLCLPPPWDQPPATFPWVWQYGFLCAASYPLPPHPFLHPDREFSKSSQNILSQKQIRSCHSLPPIPATSHHTHRKRPSLPKGYTIYTCLHPPVWHHSLLFCPTLTLPPMPSLSQLSNSWCGPTSGPLHLSLLLTGMPFPRTVTFSPPPPLWINLLSSVKVPLTVRFKMIIYFLIFLHSTTIQCTIDVTYSLDVYFHPVERELPEGRHLYLFRSQINITVVYCFARSRHSINICVIHRSYTPPYPIVFYRSFKIDEEEILEYFGIVNYSFK